MLGKIWVILKKCVILLCQNKTTTNNSTPNIMSLTISQIKSSFKKYNKKYFCNKLPEPKFSIVTTKSYLGLFGTRNGEHFIKISNYYVRPEHDIDQTIIHEMIHMYLRVTGKEDRRKPHGKAFIKECERINKDGWNISRTSSISGCKLSKEANNKNSNKGEKTYNIIGYKTKNGSYFVFRACSASTAWFTEYFKHYPDYFLDYFMFTTTDSLYDSWNACKRKIRGYYVTVGTYNTMKIFHKGFKRLAA